MNELERMLSVIKSLEQNRDKSDSELYHHHLMEGFTNLLLEYCFLAQAAMRYSNSENKVFYSIYVRDIAKNTESVFPRITTWISDFTDGDGTLIHKACLDNNDNYLITFTL